ncbi:hypothetical protein Tco_0796683 [Tanacetum coccineum]
MTSSNNQMHNDIMVAGSKERPPMLAPSPHVFGQVKKVVEGENTNQEEEFIVETYENTTNAVRKLIDAGAEKIHMILNGIGNDIYSTIDACTNAKKMWIAIEHLQQRESINIQDVKTKLFWEFASEEDNDEELAQRDKKIQKGMALIANTFKNIYKPTKNNLRTSLNTRNKNMDTSPRTRNDKQTMQFVNQRAVIVAGNRETIGTQVVQLFGIHCYNYKGFDHYEKEYKSAKRDTNDEHDEKELEAHYMYMAKIQEVLTTTDDNSGPTYNTKPLEKVHSNDDYNVFATERQHSEQPEFINDTYVVEKVNSNVIPDSSYTSTNKWEG